MKPKIEKSPPRLFHPNGSLILNTEKDWEKADEIIKKSPPLSCEIFGVELFITD